MRPAAGSRGRRVFVTPLAWALALSCGGGDGTGPSAIRVADVEVTGAGNALAAGSTMQLLAVARDSVGAAISGAAITWSSSSASVASVSTSGLVRGVSAGSATVSAAAGGISATWNVAVRDTASLPRVLSGRIERVNATLTGTYTVSDDFALIADSTIRVNGTIRIEPGASFILWADGLLALSGTVAMDSSAMAARRRLTNEATTAPDNHEQLMFAGFIAGKLVIDGFMLTVGCPLAISGHGLNSSLELTNSKLIASDGAHGTRAQPTGQLGCNVEIGTAEANRQIEARIKRPTQPLAGLKAVDTKIFGGKGGDGYTMTTQDGDPANNTWVGFAGSGGAGGDVAIEATRVEIVRSDVRPGTGGFGGGIAVTLRDGGPRGDGESLVSGSGHAGAAGDLVLFASQVVSADKLSEAEVRPPGGFQVFGGSGRSGGKGGELRMLVGVHSTRGIVSVPPGVSVEQSPPNFGLFKGAIITDAANGGDGTSPTINGGNGGDIIFETAALNSPHLRSIVLNRVSNGGKGFDGCAVTPKRNGSDGGFAGTIRRKQVPMTHMDSFNGGDGGPGISASGLGGQRGADIDANNLPIGEMGINPMPCPQWFGLSGLPSNFQHAQGTSPCPHPVATATVSNISVLDIRYNAFVVGNALTWGNASGTLQPGGSTTMPLTYPCNQNSSFKETVIVEATPVNGGPTQTVTHTIVGEISYLAVRLNHPLGLYPAGRVIPLSRIGNGRLNAAHLPFCAVGHLHAATPAGIVIADDIGGTSGPHVDPEPGGCGYGEIITVVSPVPANARQP